MDITQLEQIGLKEKEAKVYLALLKEGPSLANQLAKSTDILRASIYDYLDILIDKGFVSYVIKSGKKYFQALEPEKIFGKFEEQKKRQEESLKNIIPQLQSIVNTSKNRATVEVFEGVEGMKNIFNNILKEKPKEMIAHGSSGASYKIIPFFMEHWHKQRIKEKIFLRVVYNDVPESRERVEKGPTLKFSSVKFADTKVYSKIGTLIYNNTVVITIFDPEFPLAISITNKEISDTYRNEFEQLWKQAKA